MNTDELIREIKIHLASQPQGLWKLDKLPDAYPAYTYRFGVEFGFAIATTSSKEIYEEASQISIKSLSSAGTNLIVLACCDESFRNEFAKLGVYFIEPGEKGENRKTIMTDTLSWWNKWISMLGNRVGGRKSYDTIAEMLALDTLYLNDKTIEWAASHAGSHDIESSTKSYEVKSTLKKSETTVTISSQFQLDSKNELQLFFYRLERSALGLSINDVKNMLVNHGYDESLLESQLNDRGFKKGNSIRDEKFKVLELRRYIVDDKFPKIVESSFKGDIYPKNIIKILYTIDLEGIDYF